MENNHPSQNATKHGCCSETAMVLKHENLADYQALEATWFKAYSPKNDAENRLVQQLVNADWLSERANRAVLQFESELFNTSTNPSDWTENQLKRLALLTRYQTARTNAVIKARKAVEDYRKTRFNEVFKLQNLQMHKEKHKIHKDRYSTDIAGLMKEMHQSDNDIAQLRQQLTNLMK